MNENFCEHIHYCKYLTIQMFAMQNIQKNEQRLEKQCHRRIEIFKEIATNIFIYLFQLSPSDRTWVIRAQASLVFHANYKNAAN